MDMKHKRAIYRIKDLETGEYVAIHFRTDSKAVIMSDGQTLEDKIGDLENPDIPLATIEVDGLLSHLDKQKLDRLTYDLIEKIEGLDVSDFDVIREQLANQLTINEELTTGLEQAQNDIQKATDRINSFISSNNGLMSEITLLKQEVATAKSNIGNLESLNTTVKHS